MSIENSLDAQIKKRGSGEVTLYSARATLSTLFQYWLALCSQSFCKVGPLAKTGELSEF